MSFENKERLRNALQCPSCGGALEFNKETGVCFSCKAVVSFEEGAYVFPSPMLPPDYASPPNHGSNPYHEDCIKIIDASDGGIALNFGAGAPQTSFPNVVEQEIFNYASTDVVCAGPLLPYKDCSMDGVFSLSVLEHVPDPFTLVNEIHRILKPGGKAVLHAAFMQPFHGAPSHYFNVSSSGMATLFRSFRIENLSAGAHQHLWIALWWMLSSYCAAIRDEGGKSWFLSSAVGDILKLLGGLQSERRKIIKTGDFRAMARELADFNRSHEKELGALLDITDAGVEELAAGFYITATKVE